MKTSKQSNQASADPRNGMQARYTFTTRHEIGEEEWLIREHLLRDVPIRGRDGEGGGGEGRGHVHYSAEPGGCPSAPCNFRQSR